MFNFAQKPQPPSGVLRDSLGLYRRCFRRIWRWQLLWLLPLLLLDSPHWFGVNFSLFSTQAQGLNSSTISAFILSLLGTLLLIFGENFILHRMRVLGVIDPAGVPSPKYSLQVAGARFFPVLGGFILSNLVILGCLLLLMIAASLILLLISFFDKSAMLSTSTLTLSTISILVLVWVVVGTFLFFVNVLILLDDWPVIKSLKRSFYLVKGRWWATFIVLLIPLFLGFVVDQLVDLVLNLVMTPSIPFVNTLITILADVIIYPWIAAVILTQFHDLKLRKNQSVTDVNTTIPAVKG